MPHTTINGFSMYYETHGDAGEPLVLVHGYTGDVGDWTEQIPVFSKTHRVLVMDHRGHGKSEGPTDRSTYTITQMADDIEAIVAYAGFDRYHLVGHSMGGAVAQEIALRRAQRLMSLTLHDTGNDFAIGKNPNIAKMMDARNKMAEEKGMAAIAAIKSPVPDPPHMPAGRRDYERARMASMSVDGLIGAWDALRDWEGTTERARNITVPTMIIVGALDGTLKPSQYLATQVVGSTLVVVPEAVHCPQFERPELFNEALREHLARNAAASPK